jgi:bifunctional DNA-binding transcriptional regulator/antitoxin component of YhaV-PrlF toxin-antitoxin module
MNSPADPNAGSPTGTAWTGLPRLVPTDAPKRPATCSVVTAVDRDGRLANRSPVTAMQWIAGQPVSFTIEPGPIAVARPGAGAGVTVQGHLRLPLPVRRRSRITAGDRVLVVANPRDGEVLVITLTVLDELLTASRSRPGTTRSWS